MTTSREIEAIIASYLHTQAVRGFSTLNDLKNATGLISGAICQTSGKTTYKDGFGSLYRIRNITNEDVVDNDNLVAITSDVLLVAEKITNNISNAKTTGSTNTYSCDYINNTINSIIESGSNENGNWIKYADGTMICTATKVFENVSVTNSWGNLYETAELTLGNFPQQFISTPTGINCNMITNSNSNEKGSAGFVEYIVQTNNTSWGKTAIAKPVSSPSVNIGLSLIAIGKWK